MKSKLLIALSMILCLSTFSLTLTSCGNDDEPSTTQKQKYSVKGTFIRQEGNYTEGEGGPNGSNTQEYRFYKGIYDEAVEIIKAQEWEVTFKASEKDQKIKEQNALAESRYTAMVRALDAVQKKLDAADKNTYKCNFSMTIEVKAVGESVIISGQKTLKYQGNED